MSKTRTRFRPELAALEDRSTPAQLWVGSLASLSVLNDTGPAGLSNGDTVRVALPNNQFTEGTYGTNVFSTVESAVQTANTNGDASNTVRVGPGTFTLNVPQLGVTKNLDLIGYGQGTTTIKAGLNTTANGANPTSDGAATVLVNRGVTLNASSLTLDGGSQTGVDVPVLLKYTDTGVASTATSVLRDVGVQNVGTSTALTPSTAGVGVYVGNGNVTVSASALQNIGAQAVLYRGSGATGAVLGSTLLGQGSGSHVNVGVGADNSGAVTVNGNTISGFAGTSGLLNSTGVSVTGGVASTPVVDVQLNQLSGNRVAVDIGPVLSLLNTTVQNNNIVGNSLAGINSLTGGLLTGLQNYFTNNNGNNLTGLLSNGVTLSAPVTLTTPVPVGAIANGLVDGQVVNLTTGTGLPNATVYIDANGNGQLDPTEIALKTDANGNFSFNGLTVPTIGTNLKVGLVVPPGATAGTVAANVTLNPQQSAARNVRLNVTVPPSGGGGGGGSFPRLPGPGAGTPTGPGVPTDGSRVRLSAGGAGFGSSPNVTVYNPDGSVRFNFLAFDEGYKGGVRVATGDINGDGVDDLIVGAGAGAAPHVKVFDGATGALIRSFMAFDEGFKGGVSIAAGDLNRDGYDDIIVGAATGNSPHVKAFDAVTQSELKSFFAFDQGFRGGVNVTSGDVDGDGFDEIVAGAGAGANPHVKVFDGFTGATKLSFLAFAPEFRGGVTVASGDVDGDGKSEIIVGAGTGGEPRVAEFDGRTGQMKRTFLAFDPSFRGGVDVGYTDANGGDIIVGAGAGGRNHIEHFDGATGKMEKSFFAWDGTGMGGINVS